MVRAYEEMALKHEERTANLVVGCSFHDSAFGKCHFASCGFDLPYGCTIAYIWRVEHCRCGHFGAKPTLWTHACPTSSQWTHVCSVCPFLGIDVSLFV